MNRRDSRGSGLSDEIEEILFDEDLIGQRVGELAATISADYRGREIYLVGILKGAVVFVADLVRCLDLPLRLDFMAVSSYGLSSRSSGAVRILKDLDESIQGRHVLIVEDIVDTGLTLNYLYENLAARQPASLRICALLDKPSRRRVKVKVDYTGFVVPDRFIVGYGLDFAGRFRNLPFVAALRPEACRD